MTFSENSTLREIMADDRAKELLERYIPGASTHPQLHMGLPMTLKEISYYPESGLTHAKFEALVAELSKLS